MIIEKEIEDNLLSFNEEEDIYKQFERKCSYLNSISNAKIVPSYYKLQYEIQEASMNDYIELQTTLYGEIYKQFPMLDFSITGRLKSPLSHYEKIIRKYIDLIKKDEYDKPVEILDDFAMKISVYSVSYPVDKISADNNGIYIDCGPDEFRISEPFDLDFPTKSRLVTDAFEFEYNGKTITVIVKEGKENVWIDNNVPYIYTIINDEKITFPLNEAINYKKSYKQDLTPYCDEILRACQKLLNEQGFETKKRKDYIKHPKQSGYSSMQWSFYSEEQSLGIELQAKTADMEAFSNWEHANTYKPNEHKITSNSLSKVPRFVLTTMFPDGVHTLPMTEAECFEYMYGMSLKDYRKQMKASIIQSNESNTQKERDD